MQGAMQQDEQLKSLQFWRLEVHDDRSATVTARADTDVEPFVSQEIVALDKVMAEAATFEIVGGFVSSDGLKPTTI